MANIGAFDGDAHNIAIDGQSAGSSGVCNMLASPLAKGLFQRGILQSGPCSGATNSTAGAEALGQQFAARGFVVLTIDAPLQGERKPKGQRTWQVLQPEVSADAAA